MCLNRLCLWILHQLNGFITYNDSVCQQTMFMNTAPTEWFYYNTCNDNVSQQTMFMITALTEWFYYM